MNGTQIFNETIKENIIGSRKFLKGRSSYYLKFAQLAKKLNERQKIRAAIFDAEELTIPPILIISVTNNCNLNCAGCYACSQSRDKKDEMAIGDIDSIIAQGKKLGIGIVLLAGGEPLVKAGILDVIKRHADVLFVMFTNGLLIGDDTLKTIRNTKNLVAAFSLEGDEVITDERRGKGVYKRVSEVMKEMDKKRILFGSSITLTKENFDMVTGDVFLKELELSGCRVMFLIEYVPCGGDVEKCLTEHQKTKLLKRMKLAKEKYCMLIVPLPGDEERYGGCLAAGRGFLHISSTGGVEACPFAPISDINVKQTSLKEALKSELLKKIRENHHLLSEAKGGCALYENKEFVKNLL